MTRVLVMLLFLVSMSLSGAAIYAPSGRLFCPPRRSASGT